MRFLSAMLLCLGAAGLTPCFANPPGNTTATASQPATPAAKAASTPAAPATPATAATSQAAAPATAKTASTAPATDTKAASTLDADEHHLMDLGYQPEMHGGTKVWCKREVEVGSRLGSHVKTCGTAEELTLRERQAQDQFRQQQAASFQPGSQQGNVGR